MQQYFFDVIAGSYIKYDYRGREFSKHNEAYQLAEMIALDIECLDDEATGAEVQVRNVSGDLLFSIPVREPDLIAA